MLDFHGLFAFYVALFPGGVYMEIEFLRLDLHLKRKQKKTIRAAPTCSSEKKEKKKKNPETVAQRPGFAPRPGSTRAACVAGLDLARPGSA